MYGLSRTAGVKGLCDEGNRVGDWCAGSGLHFMLTPNWPITDPAMLLTSDNLQITITPGKRSGQPCIRGIRLTVSDM
jgi:hypothetical protein